ncbi:MAG: efflux RND transporter periplasmic adaptor subunit [Candidatus Sericytochromatia bacterium]
MRALYTALLIASLIVAPGCRQGQSDHAHSGGDDHGHPHAEIPSRAVTVFTPKSELFAEHRFLVVGQESRFAAHLTDLRDWTPVAEGRMEAVLASPDGRQQVYAVDGVLRPGIFQPVVKPETAGTYHLSFRVTTPKLTDTIDAGEVTVYPDAATAMAAAPKEAEDPEEIGFLKEQQWKIPFMTRPVEAAALESGVTLQGTVKPAGGREVAMAAPAAGRIAIGHGRLPQLGQRVAKGELLAVLTPAEGADTDRAALRRAVRTAEATVAQGRLDLSRAERLVAAQAAPAKRVEEARTALTIAQADLSAARDHLRAKEATLTGVVGVTEESYRLRAPLSGTVTAASVVPGASVAAGAELYHLVDLASVWVEARASENDLSRVAASRKAEITVAGGTPMMVGAGRGGLVAVGSVLDPATRTAPVIFAVPNPQGVLRIGMTASVRALTGPGARGPVIPQSAVVDDNGRPVAFVQTGGESFVRRELKLGVKQGDRVQVLSGLSPNERVVTTGGYEIRLSTLSDAVPAHGHEH